MTPNFLCTLFNVAGSAHEKFGLMIRCDNVLFAKVLVSSNPNTKSLEFLYGRCRVDTCFSLICTFYYRSLFFFGHSNLLRANVCNFRKSVDSREFLNFFIFCPNNLYSTLISKITLKLVTAFYFFLNRV